MQVNALQVFRSTPFWSDQTFTTKLQIAAFIFQVHVLHTFSERHSMGQPLKWTQIKYFSFYHITLNGTAIKVNPDKIFLFLSYYTQWDSH